MSLQDFQSWHNHHIRWIHHTLWKEEWAFITYLRYGPLHMTNLWQEIRYKGKTTLVWNLHLLPDELVLDALLKADIKKLHILSNLTCTTDKNLDKQFLQKVNFYSCKWLTTCTTSQTWTTGTNLHYNGAWSLPTNNITQHNNRHSS